MPEKPVRSRRLLWLFAATTLVPTVSLLWVGWRLVALDRVQEIRRIEANRVEVREHAVDLAVSDLHRVLAEAEEKLTEFNAAPASPVALGDGSTLLVFGREPGAVRNVWASGGKGFLHELMDVAGADNVFADVDRENVQASSELLLARAPEVIIELRAEARPAEATSPWAALPAIPAVRTNRVHALQGDQFVVDDFDDLLSGLDALNHFRAKRPFLHALDEVARDFEIHVSLEQRHAHFAQRVGHVAVSDFSKPAQVFENLLQLVGQAVEHRQAA